MHLVGLYTYCGMMHGTYNIKHINDDDGNRNKYNTWLHDWKLRENGTLCICHAI